MDCRRNSPRAVHSSIATCPLDLSMATTGRARKPRRPLSKIGGARHDGGAKAHYDGIVAFSQTDFTEDLKKISVPVLVMHSEDDQIVPYVAAAPLSAKL